MLVGMAEVKLQPNSSLYALEEPHSNQHASLPPRSAPMRSNALVVDVHKTLSVRVAKVGLVRRARVHH